MLIQLPSDQFSHIVFTDLFYTDCESAFIKNDWGTGVFFSLAGCVEITVALSMLYQLWPKLEYYVIIKSFLVPICI